MTKIEPYYLLEKFYSKIPQGKILDIGCGPGNNSIFLARQNFEVLAIDINQEYIEKLSNLAEKESINLTAKRENIINFNFDEFYSSILAINCLQFLKKSERDAIIKKIKTSLKKGGLVFISAFTIQDNSYKNLSEKNQPTEKNTFCSKKPEGYWNFFNLGELKSYFEKEYKILQYNEKIINDAHPIPHQHGIVEIVAQKK